MTSRYVKWLRGATLCALCYMARSLPATGRLDYDSDTAQPIVLDTAALVC